MPDSPSYLDGDNLPLAGDHEIKLLHRIAGGIHTLLENTRVPKGAAAVTPSDSTVLENVRALWVGTGGDVAVTLGGTEVVLANVADGTRIEGEFTKVLSTGTTASDIVAFT